ncbi:cupin domain-containing protein [Pseudomonas sp. Kh13]|uniref:cupin domain-containing protein n=1 Tax=Pseudomonas sp. Kh13 TaxID=2093744 RepID=UPI001184293D|nr:cupin domain-containing protein [Pseudomonas sp. Kh13]
MLVNADFSQPAVVLADDYQWVTSPQQGVERVMLDRLGGEKARATSIVRYAPHSSFPRHTHPGGEEILVLCGTFSEGEQHYPAGYYLRNPPGSSHQPSSHEGAIIFVKLWQMKPDDHASVCIDTRNPVCWVHQEGRAICALFHSAHEQVSLQRLAPAAPLLIPPVAGAELLVVTGEVAACGKTLRSGSWMRQPKGLELHLTAGGQGATVYLKTGHLADTPGHR